jgi:hypothetical protein
LRSNGKPYHIPSEKIGDRDLRKKERRNENEILRFPKRKESTKKE